MGRDSNPVSDDVTVLVFKDNFAARTFRLPLAWLTRVGLLIVLLVAITGGGIYFSIKFYRLAQRSSPDRVQDLEQELADLRAMTKGTTPAPAPQKASEAQPQAPAQSDTPPTAAAGGSGNVFAFAAFPSKVRGPTGEPQKILLQGMKTSWFGKTLNLRFAIQYKPEDKGAQQGKILVVARGPEMLQVYPAGALAPSGSPTLIDPEKGEYFSVARYREVRAQFGPLKDYEALKSLEIFLFDESMRAIVYEKLPVELPRRTAPPPAATAPSAVVAPPGTPATLPSQSPQEGGP